MVILTLEPFLLLLSFSSLCRRNIYSMYCRSNHRTPIKGLYLCGSGSHPGGGVMGAPGHNAAHVVLEDLPKP